MNVVGVFALFLVNVAFGFFASIIAVGGDGSAQGVYFVGSIFGAVNVVSAIWAIILIIKKRQSAALMVAAMTSPAAIAVTFVLGLTIALVREAGR
jgi:hypothetical protein